MLKPAAVQGQLERWQVDFVAAVALRLGAGVGRVAAKLVANSDAAGLVAMEASAGMWPVIRCLELDGFVMGVREVSGGVECELVRDRALRAQLRLLVSEVLA